MIVCETCSSVQPGATQVHGDFRVANRIGGAAVDDGSCSTRLRQRRFLSREQPHQWLSYTNPWGILCNSRLSPVPNHNPAPGKNSWHVTSTRRIDAYGIRQPNKKAADLEIDSRAHNKCLRRSQQMRPATGLGNGFHARVMRRGCEGMHSIGACFAPIHTAGDDAVTTF
jgi:hypothetical protein